MLLKQLIMKESTAACSPTVSLLIFYITKQLSKQLLLEDLGQDVDLDIMYVNIRLLRCLFSKATLTLVKDNVTDALWLLCAVVTNTLS